MNTAAARAGMRRDCKSQMPLASREGQAGLCQETLVPSSIAVRGSLCQKLHLANYYAPCLYTFASGSAFECCSCSVSLNYTTASARCRRASDRTLPPGCREPPPCGAGAQHPCVRLSQIVPRDLSLPQPRPPLACIHSLWELSFLQHL